MVRVWKFDSLLSLRVHRWLIMMFLLLTVCRQADCSSSIYVVHILTQAMVVVTDPDVIKDIVMQPKNPKSSYMMNKFGYLFGERWVFNIHWATKGDNNGLRFMGRGIFSIPDYDVWKPRRRMYDSAFKKRYFNLHTVTLLILLYFPLHSYLEGILPAFNGCIDLFLEKLAPFTDGVTPVPMKEHLSEVTLDVISKVQTICYQCNHKVCSSIGCFWYWLYQELEHPHVGIDTE